MRDGLLTTLINSLGIKKYLVLGSGGTFLGVYEGTRIWLGKENIMILPDIPADVGAYDFYIAVTGENTPTVTAIIRIGWNGSWIELVMEILEDV